MNELTNAARGAHTLVVAVVVAILAFAFIPDRSRAYADALEDLRILRGLQVADFKAYVREQVDANPRCHM